MVEPGIISSTLLTLVVLPALYRIVHRIRDRPSDSDATIAATAT